PKSEASSSCVPGLWTISATICAAASISSVLRIGSPKARAPGSVSAPIVKKRPSSAASSSLSVGWAWSAEAGPSASPTPKSPAARRRILGVVFADRGEVPLKPGPLTGGRGEQLFQLVPLLEQLVLLLAELHLLELAQAAQAHVQDRFGLAIGEAELGHHHRLR